MRHISLTSRKHAHMRSDIRRYQLRHPRLSIANNHHVNVERLQRINRIQHALAFDARRELHLQMHHMCAQPLASELKRHTRASGWLSEKISDGHSAQDIAD